MPRQIQQMINDHKQDPIKSIRSKNKRHKMEGLY